MGGYLETSEIQNNGYYGGGNRYAYMVARIPKDQVDDFVKVVGDAALIANKQETVEDVTLAYTDTQSRIKAPGGRARAVNGASWSRRIHWTLSLRWRAGLQKCATS
ncbi:MAG: DUF4349 domain-containing protein [Clostridia bacterium]